MRAQFVVLCVALLLAPSSALFEFLKKPHKVFGSGSGYGYGSRPSYDAYYGSGGLVKPVELAGSASAGISIDAALGGSSTSFGAGFGVGSGVGSGAGFGAGSGAGFSAGSGAGFSSGAASGAGFSSGAASGAGFGSGASFNVGAAQAANAAGFASGGAATFASNAAAAGGLSGAVGSSGASLQAVVDGGLQGSRICPAVTQPVVKAVTQTQVATEYVTVPLPVTSVVLSTVPLHKTLYVTATQLTTLLEAAQTGYCTTTHLFYSTVAVTTANLVTVTNRLTETNLVQETITATNTLTTTAFTTTTKTNTKQVWQTVTTTVYTTATAATWVQLTDTVTASYDVWTQTVESVPQGVWVTTTEMVWNAVTVTKTKTKVGYKTVWQPCGGY